MGLFEENPWVLIPIIVLTVEIWSGVKWAARALTNQRRVRAQLGPDA